MVSRSEVDRTIGPGEALAQEGDRVRCEAVVLEEIAGAQDGVDAFLIGQLEDAGQRLAPVAAPQARGLGRRPGERGVEMEVGEMEDPHDSQA